MAKLIRLQPRRKPCGGSTLIANSRAGQKTCFQVVTPIHFEIGRRLGPNALRTVLYLKGLQGRPTTFDCIAADLQMDAAASLATLTALERAGQIRCSRFDCN